MNKINYIIVAFSILILAGCDSFLDRSPISNANENIFYQTEEDFIVAVDAAYNSLIPYMVPKACLLFSVNSCRTMHTATIT